MLTKGSEGADPTGLSAASLLCSSFPSWEISEAQRQQRR